MAITMDEIARKMNVSVATVSRALSGRPQTVSAQVRREIEEVARRYGYKKRRTVGVMDSLKQSGVQIPDDISVVGFDDIALSHEVVPSLTTVHVPRKTMGMLAVQRLLKTIQGKKDPFIKVIVPTSLVVRGSTAKSKD